MNKNQTAYTITIGEMIGEFEKAKTRQAKKAVLEKHKDIPVLQHLLRGIFDPKVQWTINEEPDYMKDVEALCDSYERHETYKQQIERMSNQLFVDEEWNKLIVDLIGPAPSYEKAITDVVTGKQLSLQGFRNQQTRW